MWLCGCVAVWAWPLSPCLPTARALSLSCPPCHPPQLHQRVTRGTVHPIRHGESAEKSASPPHLMRVGSPEPGGAVANVSSSGGPLGAVCSFERKGMGSTHVGSKREAECRWAWGDAGCPCNLCVPLQSGAISVSVSLEISRDLHLQSICVRKSYSFFR